MRFQIELEFVQCLANPNYLNFLAQRGFFKDKSFCNYLSYLQYWSRPEYAKFIKYPMCLYFLELLQYEHFRREIASGQCAKFIEDQQLLHWQHYTRKRARLLQQCQDPKDIGGTSSGLASNGSASHTGTAVACPGNTGNQVQATPSTGANNIPSMHIK